MGPTLDYRRLNADGSTAADLGDTPPTAPGSYAVVATFAGSADYTAASSRATFTIWPAGATATAGLYDAGTSTFYLQYSDGPGLPDTVVPFQPTSDPCIPVAGDWTDSGTTRVGLYDPKTSTFYLANSNAPGTTYSTVVFQPTSRRLHSRRRRLDRQRCDHRRPVRPQDLDVLRARQQHLRLGQRDLRFRPGRQQLAAGGRRLDRQRHDHRRALQPNHLGLLPAKRQRRGDARRVVPIRPRRRRLDSAGRRVVRRQHHDRRPVQPANFGLRSAELQYGRRRRRGLPIRPAGRQLDTDCRRLDWYRPGGSGAATKLPRTWVARPRPLPTVARRQPPSPAAPTTPPPTRSRRRSPALRAARVYAQQPQYGNIHRRAERDHRVDGGQHRSIGTREDQPGLLPGCHALRRQPALDRNQRGRRRPTARTPAFGTPAGTAAGTYASTVT